VASPFLASVEFFDPATGTWASPGPLATARYGHTATLLADGRVLVAGGYGTYGDYLASAELFNPATGTWSPTGSLATGRSSHTATLLKDGRVLVAGGYDGTYLNSAELFNPATGAWSAADSLTLARRSHTATRLRDGRVLTAGGVVVPPNHLVSAELHDPLNLVANCSFETAGVDSGVRLPAGSDAIAEWLVLGDGIDYRGAYWQPAEGRRSLDLNAAEAGAVRTSIITSPGVRYQVTFAMAGHPLGGPAVKTLRVSAAGQSKDFSFDTTGKSTTNMGWTTKSFIFTANGTLALLTFESLTSGSFGPALDNVRVVRHTPAPPLLPLLLD
jgi:choice-of-anchor C domain-containing protein